MLIQLERVLDKFKDVFFYRLTIVGIILYHVAVAFDMRWHTLNPIRSDYFIIPHIIVYLSVSIMLFSLFILKLKKYNISLYVFILFPLASMFDSFWHSYFGVELSTSPMMFWSPAHWCFGVIMLYIVYSLLKTNIETDKIVLVFVKAIFFANFVRFFYYLWIPLGPYSPYVSLHSIFNILIPVAMVFLPITCYKIIQNKLVFLMGLLLLSSCSTRLFNFFVGNNYIYNTDKILLLIYVVTFLVAVSFNLKLISYILYSYFTVAIFFVIVYLGSSTFNIQTILVSCIITTAFITLYYVMEEYLLEFLRKKNYLDKIRVFFD